MHIEASKKKHVADPLIVLAVEMGCGPLPITLPSGDKLSEYNYIMMPLLDKGTLLALLMRANHNNGSGRWFVINVQLKRCFIKQLYSVVF
jgi:hypothetical protein